MAQGDRALVGHREHRLMICPLKRAEGSAFLGGIVLHSTIRLKDKALLRGDSSITVHPRLYGRANIKSIPVGTGGAILGIVGDHMAVQQCAPGLVHALPLYHVPKLTS